MKFVSRGFTIVELVIVIAVIGILATVTVFAYNGVQERGNYTKAQSDLRHIYDALIIYKSKTGSYPNSYSVPNFFGYIDSYDNNTNPDGSLYNLDFLKFGNSTQSLIPNYLDSTPTVKRFHGGKTFNYTYCSDGTYFKLLRYTDNPPLPSVEMSLPLVSEETETSSASRIAWGGANGREDQAWGYWTAWPSSNPYC